MLRAAKGGTNGCTTDDAGHLYFWVVSLLFVQDLDSSLKEHVTQALGLLFQIGGLAGVCT